MREFIRKPYVIANYMYSNGVRPDELAMLQYEGVLKHATYAKHTEVTEQNLIEAGRDVFVLTCTRCHITAGINGVVNKSAGMYGRDQEWDAGAMKAYMSSMHVSRTYMPSFPGNEKEAEALVAYIKSLQKSPEFLKGAQPEGVQANPLYPHAPLQEVTSQVSQNR